ncbi:ribonuclease HII [Spiroplasma sabaudiense Ar-1343]|uniref:Ribonuclease HII n=1 Tax=Spiroplasma sabaudiense Ar-1343 TaxID=1276257 RepID=W6AJ16_9MOLU|nr:ribonuclease HII [Spiroplasma sabaudiense]AHI53684.1 ribonuclease HII [Spiroplasma sabaudiense Ar-1343]
MKSANKRFLFDQNIRFSESVNLISGSDEVGRGAMAGPVVVASIILPSDYDNERIKDSKLLSSKQRDSLYQELVNIAIDYKISIIDHSEVDRINPKQASCKGMIETISQLEIVPQLALTDGERVTVPGVRNLAIIKGDNLSQTIGAASILAKVTRDEIMLEYAKRYPEYQFDKHKGYCTIAHQKLVKELGVLPIHRKTYKPIIKILKEGH